MKRLINSRVCIVMVVAIVIGLVYLLTMLTPLYADDFTYSYSFADGFGSKMREQKITDFSSLIQSQIGHYKVMNGRIVAHTLVQVFLIFDKGLFNAVNAAVFALLGLLICYHAVGKWKKIRALDLIATYTALFLMAPSFGQSYLWLTGSCNYLFTFVLVLLFLIPYRACEFRYKHTHVLLSVFCTIAMFVFGVVAGNTNENTGVSLAVVLLVFIVFFIIKNRSVSAWMITGWIGVILGAVLAIVAPGNTLRTGGALVEFSLGSIIKMTVLYTSSLLQQFAPLIVLIGISVSGILLIASRKKGLSLILFADTINNNFYEYFYGLFFLGSVYAMTIPAQFPPRAWSHPLALLLIVLLMLLRQFIALCDFQQKESKVLAMAVALSLVFTSATVYVSALGRVRAISVENSNRIATIQEAKQNGETVARVSSIITDSRYSCFKYLGDISEDSGYWVNQGMAKYYGIEKIEKAIDFVP